jgi:hypothetical protein
MELSAKTCDTPLNIFGIPHGYSIQTSFSQPGLIRTPLGVPREIVEQINISKYHQKFQIALKISRKFVSGNWRQENNLRALPTASLFLFCFHG